jgi:hypothetical protein
MTSVSFLRCYSKIECNNYYSVIIHKYGEFFVCKDYSLKYYILSAPNLPVTHTQYHMSNEILLGKLSANGTVDVESPIVVEKKTEEGKKKKKRQGSLLLLLLFLMAVGLGAAAAAVALTSVTLPAPVAFYGRVDSPDSIDDSGSGGGDGAAAVIPTALAASAAVTDGKGTVIEPNGLTKSGEMVMTGYSDRIYSTELRCSIDSLPVHCSGSPVTLSGLPPGEHELTIAEPMHDGLTVKSFSWVISE